MDFYNVHFNSPKLVYCLLIIFLGVLTAPGLADWGRKSPIRNFRGESNPSGNYIHPCSQADVKNRISNAHELINYNASKMRLLSLSTK